jgi:hypothetical protein
MHAQLLVRWLFYPTRIPSFAIVVVVVNIIDNVGVVSHSFTLLLLERKLIIVDLLSLKVIGIMARKSYAGYIQVDEKFDDAVEGGAVGDLPRLGFVKK